MSAVFLIHPGELVEAGDLASDLDVEFTGIEAGDAADAAAAFEKTFSECRAANAIRADDAHAGDDDASFVHGW